MLTTDTHPVNGNGLRPRRPRSRPPFGHCEYLGLAIATAGILNLAAPTASDAAIAPWYERIRQFEFVMTVANDAAGKLAPHGSIDSIDRVDDGAFRFRAGACFVPVSLQLEQQQDEQPPRLGVQLQYKVSLGDVSCD